MKPGKAVKSHLPKEALEEALNADDRFVGPVGVDDAIVCTIGPHSTVDSSADFIDLIVGAFLAGLAHGFMLLALHQFPAMLHGYFCEV